MPWHLESSAHSSPSVERWDDAQPTVRYLTWPISRRPDARALPPGSPPPRSFCPGLWHPLTHEHHFFFSPKWGLLKLCQCFSRSANCDPLPPFFWSRASVKPARKWRLFHTVTTFVSYHTLYLLSESHRGFYPSPVWPLSAGRTTMQGLFMEAVYMMSLIFSYYWVWEDIIHNWHHVGELFSISISMYGFFFCQNMRRIYNKTDRTWQEASYQKKLWFGRSTKNK